MKFKQMFSRVKQFHNDRKGSASLETILIIGAIALPILIFVIKFGWPAVRDYFFQGIDTLEGETDSMIENAAD